MKDCPKCRKAGAVDAYPCGGQVTRYRCGACGHVVGDPPVVAS